MSRVCSNRLFLLCVLPLLLVCQESPTDSDTPEVNLPGEPTTAQDSLVADLLADNSLPPQLQDIVLSAWSGDTTPSSLSRIAQAAADGLITEEQSLLYRVYAKLAPHRVPPEYAGRALGRLEGDLILLEVSRKWSSLSAQTQQLLAPYRVFPRDTGSAFTLPKRNSGSDLPDENTFLYAANNRVIIDYYDEGNRQQGVWAAEAIDYAWPLYEQLLGVEPTDILTLHAVIFFYEEGGVVGTCDGLFDFVDGKPRIQVQPFETECKVKATVVHELFHAFQYYYGLLRSDSSWIEEATAVWAEEVCFAACNSEHEYHDEIFPVLNMHMLSERDNHEYGSYLWFYFIYQNHNKSKQSVLKYLERAKTQGTRAALVNSGTFGADFSTYAFWNWNREPFQYYQDQDGFNLDGKGQAYGSAIDLDTIGYDKKKTKNVEIDEGGMQYYVTFVKQGVELLRVRLSELIDTSDTNRAVQAITYIGGEWQRDDWSKDTLHIFDRDKADERIDMLVIIVSNANLEHKIQGHYELDASIPAWHGTITLTKTSNQNMVVQDKELIIAEKLYEEEDDDCIRYVVAEQVCSYSETSTTTWPCLVDLCTGSQVTEYVASGATSRTAEDAPGDDPIVRISRNKSTNILEMVPDASIYGVCDYVSSTSTLTVNCSCPDGISNNYTTTESDSLLCHYFGELTGVAGFVQGTRDSTGRVITGLFSTTSELGGFSGQIEWRYEYR